jgi:hypothetical protein
LRESAFAPYYSRSIPSPLAVKVLGYVNPYAVCLRLAYSTLITSIIPYYLGVSNYLLDRRRVAANSYAKYAVFRILTDLIVF